MKKVVCQSVGTLLILAPFIALFIFIWVELGIKMALGIFLACSFVIFTVSLGVFILSECEKNEQE